MKKLYHHEQIVVSPEDWTHHLLLVRAMSFQEDINAEVNIELLDVWRQCTEVLCVRP